MTKLEEIKDHFRVAPKATRDEVFWLIEMVKEAQLQLKGICERCKDKTQSRNPIGWHAYCSGCLIEAWLRKAGE